MIDLFLYMTPVEKYLYEEITHDHIEWAPKGRCFSLQDQFHEDEMMEKSITGMKIMLTDVSTRLSMIETSQSASRARQERGWFDLRAAGQRAEHEASGDREPQDAEEQRFQDVKASEENKGKRKNVKECERMRKNEKEAR